MSSGEDSIPVHGAALDAEALQPHHTFPTDSRPPITKIRDVESYQSKSSNRPGKVLLFKNREFTEKGFPLRQAADDEETAVRQTFEAMGFNVEETLVDLDFTKIDIRLKTAFKRDKYDEYDSLFVIISTYGKDDSNLMARDNAYSFEGILHEYMNSQGKSLAGLPKVFIIQAYGPESDKEEPLKPGAHEKKVEKPPLIPVFADLFIAYASRPGYSPPKRNNTSFIKILCETIREQVIDKPAKERQIHDLETIVDITRSKIATKKEEIPISVTTLTRQFYFPKYLPNETVPPN